MAIVKSLNLLPHQYDLVCDYDTKVLGLVAGLGSGKTFAIARKAMLLMDANRGFDGIITEPNYPLLVQILIPELKAALDFFQIKYKFNKADMIFYCYPNGVETRIICKSLENHDRLIGINAAWVIMDEFDTTRSEIAYTAYLKLLGRIRVGNKKQMVVVSTPEGFRAMHRVFIKEADSGDKRLLKAKTTDNKYLSEDYIQTMVDLYPAQLLAAYLHGEFVNLAFQSVYSEFDRTKNATDRVVEDGDVLNIGIDFNVGKMAAAAFVTEKGTAYAVDEFTDYLDTPALINAIKQRYEGHRIMVYPDASGASRKSQNASESDIALLRNAGFIVQANKKNPFVRDRILSVNVKIKKKQYLVNVDNCPNLVEALEQQAYDKNGDPDKDSGHDHINDAMGYFISFAFPVADNKGSSEVQITGI